MSETITIDEKTLPILRGKENYREWHKEIQQFLFGKGIAFKRAVYGFQHHQCNLSKNMDIPPCSAQELYDAHHRSVEIIYLTLGDGPYSMSLDATNAFKLLYEIEQKYAK
jgi:hypothetical protein